MSKAEEQAFVFVPDRTPEEEETLYKHIRDGQPTHLDTDTVDSAVLTASVKFLGMYIRTRSFHHLH